MDNGNREGRGVLSGVHVPQDRPACLGSPSLKAPQGPPPNSTQLGFLRRQTTGNGAGGHHQCDSGYLCKVTIGVIGASRSIFIEPPTLAAVVRGGKYGAQADYWGIWGLDGQWSPTLGGLQGTAIGAPHRPQQFPWSKASCHGGDLVSDVGKVRADGDSGGGQGGLRDGTTLRWTGCGYRSGDTCDADPVAESFPEGGMGVPPHCRAQCVQRG